MEESKYPWRARLVITKDGEPWIHDKRKNKTHSEGALWLVHRLRLMLDGLCERSVQAVMNEDRNQLVLIESTQERALIQLLLETVNLILSEVNTEKHIAALKSMDVWELKLDFWNKNLEDR